MSVPIKVTEDVHQRLDKMRTGRQTYSDIIKALLDAREGMLETWTVLEGALGFTEWRRQKLIEATKKGGE